MEMQVKNRFKSTIPFYEGGNKIEQRTDGPLNRGELKLRQAWLESKFDPAVVGRKGAVGLFQIMKTALNHFNTRHKGGRQYTMKDMKNLQKNTDVRNWLLDDLENSTMANKEMSGDSISYAKALGGFNWGRGNMSNALVEAKNAGVDIYDSWDWLPYLPQETQSYINFILRGQNVNNKLTKATNAEYEKDKANNSTTVNKVLNIGYKK